MSKQSMESYSEQLVESARRLLSATADATDGTIQDARFQMETALGEVRSCAVKGLRTADRAARENPWALAGIAFTLGLVVALAAKLCRK